MGEGNGINAPFGPHTICATMPGGAGSVSVGGPGRIVRPLTVVGVGASACGADALRRFFASVPPDSGLGFVVVHSASDMGAVLPGILAGCTMLRVLTVEDGIKLLPDTVYVSPAGGIAYISGDSVRLRAPGRRHEARYPTDLLLRSLAAELGERACAVILSGVGDDGVEGAMAVKRAGGIVCAQEPASAACDHLPLGVVEAGAVDMLLPAHLIPGKLLEVVPGAGRIESAIKIPVELDDQLRAIFRIVKSRTGNDFSSYKTNTVMRRIERRMILNGVGVVGDYLALLKENPREADELCREFLIGVTSFFRDPEAFEKLRESVIPGLFAGRDPEDPVRIWHAGCATGEEAYSTAILIREYLEERQLDARVQIFATDIDERAIARARAGSYHEGIEADLSEQRLRSFFTAGAGRYQVIKPLREMVIFAHHNIIRDPPFSRLDLLVCRNFLIYLNPEMQMRLIPLFHQVLKPGGVLFLGGAETIERHSDLFIPVDKKWKIFERSDAERRMDIGLPLVPRVWIPNGAARDARPCGGGEQTPGMVVEKLLMERYSPPCVVVNERYEVVHVSTRRTGLFLELAPGEPNQDILKMAREELRPTLRAAIHKAFSEQKQAVFRGVRLCVNGDSVAVNVLAEPVTLPSSRGRLAMVVFEPCNPPASASPESPTAGCASSGEVSCRDVLIRQLEEQLRVSHEQLQATIEQLETSNEGLMSANEELMSTNEEFQATNEELQSTNEELETSREELQALNEELVTVNAELQGKVEELNHATSDMENLLNSSEIATVFLDRRLNIKRFTPAMADILDLIPSDIGRPFRHMAGKIEWPEFSQDTAEVLRQETLVEREISVQKEGRCYIMRVLPYRSGDGRVDGIVVTLLDITERKLSEEALRRSEERLRRLTDHLPCYVCYVDREERYRFANETYRSWFGLDPASILGLKIEELVGPENYGTIKPHVDEALAGRTVGFDYQMNLPTGAKRYVNVTYVPDSDARGVIGGFYVTAIDLTEQKRAEESLRESEERWQFAIEGSNDGVWDRNVRTGEVFFSRQWKEMLGFGEDEIGSSVDEWFGRIHPGDQARVREELEKHMQGETGKYSVEFRMQCKDGSYKYILARGKVISRTEDGEPIRFVGTQSDMTERKSLEAQLYQAQKMEAVGQLAGGVAHDFNNILTAILGYAHLLLMQMGEDDRMRYYVEQVRVSAERAAELTKGLLTFSRKQVMVPKVVNLNETVLGVRNILRRLISENIELRFDMVQEDLHVLADGGKIEQVLMNLATNAKDAMPKGGVIVIRTSRGHSNIGFMREHDYIRPGEYARLTVSDTGCGMDEATKRKIFEPFFTTKEVGKGTGLGLSIVYGIVKQHNGFIEVHSDEGTGTAFNIFLPLVEPPDDHPDGEDEPAPPRGSGTILLAEDDPSVREFHRMLFTSVGYEVITASHGMEAFEKFKAQEDDIDLLVFDVIMPQMNGKEAYELIRGKRPELKVLFLSGYAGEILNEAGVARDREAILHKPVKPSELLRRVHGLLKTRAAEAAGTDNQPGS